ncbi:hypothetical protein G7067_00280 [Leucobacter insecticola]|uniref:Uncharacterized protein n=1 Tax=Leucobacter insecticola TaxID=2714934 RepID=A0A6G8FFQ0_9MICO|nr:hypothetical protein [Leucobacter insecticola]QIM15201.1 hypothetical protein G7067_00280 [Leucobacter insecticola]
MPTNVHTRSQDPRTVVLAATGGISRQARLVAWALTLVVLLLGAVALAAAGALPILADTSNIAASEVGRVEQPGAQPGIRSGSERVSALDPQRDGPATIEAHWGDDALHLDWTGRPYVTAEATFVGDRVMSPGDRIEHTLVVVNSGPSEAAAQIVLTPRVTVPERAQNLELPDDVLVFWDVAGVTGTSRYADLARDTAVAIAEVAVPRGSELPVTVGVVMGAETESSRAMHEASTMLDFGVSVRLSGAQQPGTPLAITGAMLPIALALIAVVLVVLGVLFLLARRRRDRDEEVVILEEE